MSWLKRFSIHCSNTRCFASVTCPPECKSLYSALRYAYKQGWRRVGETDLCPKHVEEAAKLNT